VRLDKGEEILEQVKELALKERIKLASVQALGAVDRFTVGVFKTDDKKYLANDFSGSFEIVSRPNDQYHGWSVLLPFAHERGQ
jgi:predicted DNA-binding protein with PD1-like motif